MGMARYINVVHVQKHVYILWFHGCKNDLFYTNESKNPQKETGNILVPAIFIEKQHA